MTEKYSVFQKILDVMCSRCGIRKACEQTDEESRLIQICICIPKILTPNDQNYPTRLVMNVKKYFAHLKKERGDKDETKV
jgi:hypothetical protein